ncbi:MAG: porin [Hyphomicrobiaceae bacterium]|nr:porin [Hyphomicrobiaceae bacterium]
MKSNICIAALAAATLLSGISTASAADLGGDCCADLEERIAELEATTARKGNRKVSLTIYGQVNQAVMFWDDATERNAYVVNNKTSTTYFGFEGSATISPEWRAGYLIEIEVGSANSDFVDQGFVPGPAGGFNFSGTGDDSARINVRHSNWWIESKRLGRVTVGQQSNATDNIAEMDLSRTSAISLSSVETWNEGFFLRSANDGLSVFMPGLLFFGGANFSIVGDLWRGNFDGGRGNLIRYDSPVIGGFIFSAAWGEDDDWDVALRYAGSFNGVSIKAGIGYHDGQIIDSDSLLQAFGTGGGNPITGGNNVLPDHQELVGSFSLLHEPSGLFITAAGGKREWDSNFLLSEKYAYVKGGLLRKWFPIGPTSIYGEYYRIWDVGITGTGLTVDINGTPTALDPLLSEKANTLGFGVVQHIDAAAMEVYLAYRHYWANDITDVQGLLGANTSAVSDHDIKYDVIMTGARIKF